MMPAQAQPDRPDNLRLLQSHPVFGELEPDQLRRLTSFATRRKVQGGATIFCKGDTAAALFAIYSGTVKITVPSLDGREAMFNLAHAGEIFGEIALLDGRPRTADAVAMTDCELMVIDRRDFLDFVHGEPKVALRLIELLCARLRAASENLEELVFLTFPARLARTLLRLAETSQAASGRRLAVTQAELAHMLGMTRESTNKQLRVWERQGWIRLERGRIDVLAPDALARLAAQTHRE